ncbi:MAG: FGGY family carbohydrate kinase [Thermomicrobiales bacterium]
MPSAILAVDLGTTSLKATLVDDQGNTIDRESLPQIVPATVDGWFRQLQSILERLRTRHSRLDVAAIAVTGQMHGTQIYDAEGNASVPCRLWTDRSAAPHLPALLDVLGPDLPTRIGSTIAPGFQALNLFTETNWDAVSRVLLPKDALMHRLTGQWVTDPSDAAGTGLFDGGRGEWAWDVIEALSIPRRVLPNVIASGSLAGTLTSDAASNLGLPASTPVIIAGGDTPVAAVGAGTWRAGEMQIMLSTSAQVLMPTASWDPHPTARWYTWPSAGVALSADARWLRSGTMSNGGSVIDWLTSIQGDVRQSEIVPTSLIALPHLAGRRFPAADAAAAGAFLGLRAGHTSADLYAATLQGIAFSFREVVVALLENQRPPSRVRFGGGGSQIPGFAQLLATVLGVPIERIGGSDLTCDGAAMLAAHHLGWTPMVAVEGEVFEPDLDRASAFSDLYGIYLDANTAVLPISHRLDALR